ncbi:MAG: MauE/DoxX family redox-associated membrane protein [Mycobacteriales bacterium]
MVLAGVFYAAAALLVLAGAQKAADPQPLVRALRSVAVPVPRLVVRLLAAAEAALGLAALLTGSRWSSAALATSYAVFTGFVLLARAKGGVLASCGCFGKRDLPPTRTHAAVTAVLAVALGVTAAGAAPGALPLDLALLVPTAAVVACAYLVLAVLPLLSAP